MGSFNQIKQLLVLNHSILNRTPIFSRSVCLTRMRMPMEKRKMEKHSSDFLTFTGKDITVKCKLYAG